MSKNLELWEMVRTPDPAGTKPYTGRGGFKGTAIDVQFHIKRATEIWGPIGMGWGWRITQEQIVKGAPIGDGLRETIHVVRGYIWYTANGKEYNTSEQYGGTVLVGKTKHGTFTDEDAMKKSISDMVSKCLSTLGFAADVYMGMFDGNKYVQPSVPGSQQKSRQSKPKTQKPKKSLAQLQAEVARLTEGNPSKEDMDRWVSTNKPSINDLKAPEYAHLADQVKAVRTKIQQRGK